METPSLESQTQQNQITKSPESEKTRYGAKKYWKFVAGFLGIMIIAFGGFFIWEKYFSPQAKINRETQKNYEKYLEWQKNYEKAMREDTYGGKTPEETLQMFIEALKKEDIELASKYFMLDKNGNPDPKWINGLKKAKDAGKLQEIANLLSKAKPDLEARSSNEDFKFSVYENGNLKAYINLEFNPQSGVWKIESL